MIRWRLAMRLMIRNWHSGEQHILVAALVIAVAASTAIGFFTDRLGRGMANQSADFLGADLTLVSPRPVDAAWLNEARDAGLQAIIEFVGVRDRETVRSEKPSFGGDDEVDSAAMAESQSSEETSAADEPEAESKDE